MKRVKNLEDTRDKDRQEGDHSIVATYKTDERSSILEFDSSIYLKKFFTSTWHHVTDARFAEKADIPKISNA
jgi:hypothetical protein